MNLIQKLINEIALLKEFVILCCGCSLIFLFYFHLQKAKFSLTGNKMRFFGLFQQLQGKEFYLLLATTVNFLFLVSCLLRFQQLRLVHVWTLVILSIFCMAFVREWSSLISILVNQVLAGVSLVILNSIVRYLQVVRFEWSFFWIYLAAAIFIGLYFLYVYFNQIKLIMKGKMRYEKQNQSNE